MASRLDQRRFIALSIRRISRGCKGNCVIMSQLMMNAFGWAFSSAFAVSLISLAGLATIPFREENIKRIVFLLISLAAGALFGDAILHLFPEIFRTTQHPVASSMWVIAGIFSSFIFEKFLRWRQEHGLHPHDHI